jgi:hypothetical protein
MIPGANSKEGGGAGLPGCGAGSGGAASKTAAVVIGEGGIGGADKMIVQAPRPNVPARSNRSRELYSKLKTGAFGSPSDTYP